MCLDIVTQQFIDNENIEYGWKIFKIKNNELFGLYFEIFHQVPYKENTQYITVSNNQVSLFNNLPQYATGYHYFVHKKDAENEKFLIESTNEKRDGIPVCLKIKRVKMENIRVKGKQRIPACSRENDYHEYVPVHVAKKMTILGEN